MKKRADCVELKKGAWLDTLWRPLRECAKFFSRWMRERTFKMQWFLRECVKINPNHFCVIPQKKYKKGCTNASCTFSLFAFFSQKYHHRDGARGSPWALSDFGKFALSAERWQSNGSERWALIFLFFLFFLFYLDFTKFSRSMKKRALMEVLSAERRSEIR